MGLMIVIGLGVLGVTIANRLGGAKPPAPVQASAAGVPAVFGDVTLTLPPRARVVDVTMDGRRLVLHLQLAGRDRALMVVDLEDGRVLGTLRIEPDPQQP